MAISNTTGGSARPAFGSGDRPTLKTTPEAYTTLGALINPTKPDNRDLLIKAYGDQGLTGFLELTNAKKSAAVADEVTWWEEGRLHKTFTYSAMTAASPAAITVETGVEDEVRVNDVLLLHDGQRVVVTSTATNGNISVKSLKGVNTTEILSGTYKAAVIGNIYAQGTKQPTAFYQTDLEKYTNPLFITKEVFIVNGSQATNIGWVNVNGSYLWYHKNEMDARKRFMNQREMMMVFGQKGSASITLNEGTVTGSEGYFQALETRGIVADVSGGTQGTFASITDMDQIILELDKEGAPMEYAMYVDRRTSLDIDDLLAQGIATQVTAGLPGQFGAFNNDANMAIQLGFKSFTRGGYTFHKHDWKMLNDATISGLTSAGSYYKGAMIPLTTVADAKTGEKAPALEMNYKAAGNYNRDIEHFVTGSILGYATDGEDVARFNYRSECNLITRAANQHVLLR